MRKIVQLPIGFSKSVLRLMIYDTPEGTYLFGFSKPEDCVSDFDLWFENISEALDHSSEEFGVSPNSWEEIPDPPTGSMHDRISPTKIAKRDR